MTIQQWITNVIMPIILCVAGAMMTYIVWLLQQQRQENRETRKTTSDELNAIKQGVKLVLRRDIISEHNRYVNDGEPMLPLAYDNLWEEYEAYKALGGNGMTKKLMDDIEQVHIGKGGIK